MTKKANSANNDAREMEFGSINSRDDDEYNGLGLLEYSLAITHLTQKLHHLGRIFLLNGIVSMIKCCSASQISWLSLQNEYHHLHHPANQSSSESLALL